MRLFNVAGIVAFALVATSDLVAQDKKDQKTDTPPPIPLTEAEKKFDAAVSALEAFLKKTPSYSVNVESTWKGTGPKAEKDGKNLFRLLVGKDRTHFRLEARSEQDKEPGLVVVGDGKSATLYFAAKKLICQRTTQEPFEELQRDALTSSALEGSGIGFIACKDMHDLIMSLTASVQDLGSVKLDGKASHQFKITLTNRRIVDVWFAEGENGLVRQIATTVEIPVREKEVYKQTITSRFEWNTSPKIAEGDFAFKAPEGSRQVHDLMAALLHADITDLLGKPAPNVELVAMDGKATSIAAHKDKVMAIYLWASWCAPSTEDMGSLNQFVQHNEKKGAVFLAVNVGEKPEVVKSGIEKHGYKGTVVLDPKSASVEAFRVATLPAAVLIGKDGTVQAIYTQVGPATREKIEKNLDRLLKGESIVAPPAKK